MSLNLLEMFLEGHGVKINAGKDKGVLEGGKITIHKNCGNIETVGRVDLFEILDSSGQSCHAYPHP